ncbi:MAG TPA: phosphoenolpyruvate carboxykinase (ATP) [Vicinamibacterales bacterium]|nr:phosphoenolpyruvate carboxykinase (ATP) [Vicinamibacterales bacterium]
MMKSVLSPSMAELRDTEGERLTGLPGVRPRKVHANLSVPQLYEEAIRRGEGRLTDGGALACTTGEHTGRSPQDKFIVREPDSEGELWWGAVNRPMDPAHFDAVARDMAAYLTGRDVFVLDAYGGADPEYRLPVRVVTELAWHNLFARNLLRLDRPAPAPTVPGFTIVDAPGFKADPSRHGTRSDVCVLVSFSRRLVLIGGTAYAGEIKKSVFTVLNYLLPHRDVLPMHCSANIGPADDVALFFGLSGTGKTTLSSDPDRRLIGDDEHGWSPRGVFNFEGGCYAKMIRLSAAAEPQIYAATSRFGAVLENVVLDSRTGRPDFEDSSLTENTRGAYPLSYIDHHVPGGQGGHPRTIVMLTADAFGVMPPVARLTPAQAMYHFLSGYTAKVAGTERGVTEPAAVFSTCFGAPFLPLRPAVYASFLGRRIAEHGSRVWMVNTGWTGGPYGTGKRISLAHTRAIVSAVLSGALDDVPCVREPFFGFDVPQACPGVPPALLDARSTWRDMSEYDLRARQLAGMFRENFAQFEADVSPEVKAAGPVA